MNKVNIADKLTQIKDHWNPRVAGELNGQQIRLVKIIGDFPFHMHEHEEEMFLVIKGTLNLEFEETSVVLNEGEFQIVPRGVLHRPVAEKEVHLMMFVSASNVNTGNLKNDRTLETDSLETI